MAKVTPINVRQALVDCFYAAHCADTELVQDENLSRAYCLSLVKKVFLEQNVDFENPTKEGILKVVSALAEFSKSFRSQDVIAKHQQEIMSLVEQI
jgi:hypothetical protein